MIEEKLLDTTLALDHLKSAINEFPGHELRYHFLYLYDTLYAYTLKNKNEPSFYLIIAAAQRLADAIAETKNINLSDTDAIYRQHTKITKIYNELADIARVNKYPNKIVQAILNIGGALIGIMTGMVGGILGIGAGVIGSKNKVKSLLSGLTVGALTGALIGFTVGFRMPKKWFKNQFSRRLKASMDQIQNSLNILQKDLVYFEKNLNDIRTTLLDHFQGDCAKLAAFEDSQQEFEIASANAKFYHSTLKGFVGQHAFIRCQLPHKKIILELGGPTEVDQLALQSERRMVTGKTILEMIATHNTLNEKYGIRLNNIVTSVAFYKAGDRDCHTYLDMILQSSGLEKIKIERFPKKSFWLSRVLVGKSLKYASPECSSHHS